MHKKEQTPMKNIEDGHALNPEKKESDAINSNMNSADDEAKTSSEEGVKPNLLAAIVNEMVISIECSSDGSCNQKSLEFCLDYFKQAAKHTNCWIDKNNPKRLNISDDNNRLCYYIEKFQSLQYLIQYHNFEALTFDVWLPNSEAILRIYAYGGLYGTRLSIPEPKNSRPMAFLMEVVDSMTDDIVEKCKEDLIVFKELFFVNSGTQDQE